MLLQYVLALLVELQYALAPLLKPLGVAPQLVQRRYDVALLGHEGVLVQQLDAVLLQYVLAPLVEPRYALVQLLTQLVAPHVVARLALPLGVEPRLVVEQYVVVPLALPLDVELRLAVGQYVVAQLATPFDVVVHRELPLDVEPRLVFGQPFVDQLGPRHFG